MSEPGKTNYAWLAVMLLIAVVLGRFAYNVVQHGPDALDASYRRPVESPSKTTVLKDAVDKSSTATPGSGFNKVYGIPLTDARRMAAELVVTTYLRGGEDRLTIPFTPKVDVANLDESIRFVVNYGAGYPLLHWTRDGMPLTKVDLHRAFTAIVARKAFELWESGRHSSETEIQDFLGHFANTEEAFVFCTVVQVGNRSLPYKQCLDRIADKFNGGTLRMFFLADRKKAVMDAVSIIQKNRSSIEYVAKLLSRKWNTYGNNEFDPVAQGMGERWNFSWYHDALFVHKIDYSPVSASCRPGKYPVAIDDGEMPREYQCNDFCKSGRVGDPRWELIRTAEDIVARQAFIGLRPESQPDENTSSESKMNAVSYRVVGTYNGVLHQRASVEAIVFDRVFSYFPYADPRENVLQNRAPEDLVIARSAIVYDKFHQQKPIDSLMNRDVSEGLALVSTWADRKILGVERVREMSSNSQLARFDAFLEEQSTDHDYMALPEYDALVSKNVAVIDAHLKELFRVNKGAVSVLMFLLEERINTLEPNPKVDPKTSKQLLTKGDLEKFFAEHPIICPSKPGLYYACNGIRLN